MFVWSVVYLGFHLLMRSRPREGFGVMGICICLYRSGSLRSSTFFVLFYKVLIFELCFEDKPFLLFVLFRSMRVMRIFGCG